MKKRGALVLGMALAGAANAATFDFSFTNQIGEVWASGVLTTSDTANALGGYGITGISGNTNSEAITGLITAPFSPAVAYYFPDGTISSTPDWGFEWGFDNTLFTGGGVHVDDAGFMFQTATTVFNIYNNYGVQGQDLMGISTLGVWNGTSWYGTFAISPAADAAVPEPMSWMMMVGGFGFLGAVLRSRKPGLRGRQVERICA
jgi:hypothetical protein